MKHKFEGIGEASASTILAGLAANPATASLATGFSGKVIFFICKLICMYFASLGLIVLNVGAAKVDTIVTGNDLETGWDTAENIIKKIRDTGRELTEDEIKNIDGPVIDAFRKFGRFGNKRKTPRPSSGPTGDGP